VFAGAMTAGLKQAGFRTPLNLECHGFGLESARQFADEVYDGPQSSWPGLIPDWDEVAFMHGNPRCTGFSSVTCGLGEDSHGPWARQCQDLRDLCELGIAMRVPVICWESVQQAYTVGRPLLDMLRDEQFAPAGYRIAHLFINAATFGNPQQRKRYFFVAYRRGLQFNIEPPAELPAHKPCVADVLWPAQYYGTNILSKDGDYDIHTHKRITPQMVETIRNMPSGWSTNGMGKHAPELLSAFHRAKWDTRNSDMPFSLHASARLRWLERCPTLTGACSNLVHPELDRYITVGEAAALMGWPKRDGQQVIPRGEAPYAQIAKGVVPAVAKWLGEQVIRCLDGYWGDDDWESSYDDARDTWTGGDSSDKIEKVFDMTKLNTKRRPLPEELGMSEEQAYRRYHESDLWRRAV